MALYSTQVRLRSRGKSAIPTSWIHLSQRVVPNAPTSVCAAVLNTKPMAMLTGALMTKLPSPIPDSGETNSNYGLLLLLLSALPAREGRMSHVAIAPTPPTPLFRRARNAQFSLLTALLPKTGRGPRDVDETAVQYSIRKVLLEHAADSNSRFLDKFVQQNDHRPEGIIFECLG